MSASDPQNSPENSQETKKSSATKTVLVLIGAVAVTAATIIGVNQWAPNVLDGLSTAQDDASPLPNFNGAFISVGLAGNWHQADQKPVKKTNQPIGFLSANTAGNAPDVSPPPQNVPKPNGGGGVKPAADNCSPFAIAFYASQAPYNFEPTKKGLLYGVRTHTSATKVDDMPGYNSCALVVHAILKRAGCKWAKRTASAKEIYDIAWRAGWRPSSVQKAGCLVAWNSVEEGWRPRIGQGSHVDKTKKKGVKFRHVGIATGEWMAVDNTSYFSRPTPGLTYRPIRYEAPIFLCPVPKAKGQKTSAKN